MNSEYRSLITPSPFWRAPINRTLNIVQLRCRLGEYANIVAITKESYFIHRWGRLIAKLSPITSEDVAEWARLREAKTKKQ